MKKPWVLTLLGMILLFVVGCENILKEKEKEEKEEEEQESNVVEVITGNVVTSPFYYDLVFQEEVDSAGTWHVAIVPVGAYNMPSVSF